MLVVLIVHVLACVVKGVVVVVVHRKEAIISSLPLEYWIDTNAGELMDYVKQQQKKLSDQLSKNIKIRNKGIREAQALPS